MGTASNSQVELKLPLLEKPKTPKNYSHPEVLHRTFETLSNLHKLLPNHLMELLHSCKSEEDKKKCMWAEGGRQLFRKPALYRGTHAPSEVMRVCVLSRFSHVRLFVTPWTVACQAPLSVGFSSKNAGVGCHALLQGILPTQGWNHLLQCRQVLYH